MAVDKERKTNSTLHSPLSAQNDWHGKFGQSHNPDGGRQSKVGRICEIGVF